MSTTKTIDEARQKTLIFAWLDALRSGEWRQVKNRLENARGNCCLGIACRLAMSHGIALEVASNIEGECRFDGFLGMLPDSVEIAMGFNTANGQIGDTVETLAGLNDDGIPFPQIADAIEANAETLFVNGPTVRRWLDERKAAKAQ